jgi:hypothetical protein
MTKSMVAGNGRFSTAPSVVVANRICSSDQAHAAQSATYRYESRCRELQDRFEQELQGVRDAYLARTGGAGIGPFESRLTGRPTKRQSFNGKENEDESSNKAGDYRPERRAVNGS